MTDVKLLQSKKADRSIYVTEFGIVIDVKLLQPEKAISPILVTEFGIVIDVNPLQPKKASSPIIVTEYSTSFTLIEDGIVMSPVYRLSPFVTSATLPFEIKL